MLGMLVVRLFLVAALPLAAAWIVYCLSVDRWGAARVGCVALITLLAGSVILAGPAS